MYFGRNKKQNFSHVGNNNVKSSFTGIISLQSCSPCVLVLATGHVWGSTHFPVPCTVCFNTASVIPAIAPAIARANAQEPCFP